ncbi:MAG: ABC transporter permease, partial [Candidatus Aureabacteria bacterium]|nr:ABC transporter permease [Candidatus Auribacterota bacterium]
MNVIATTGRGIIDTLEGVGKTVVTLCQALGFLNQVLKYRVLVLEQMLFVGVESLPVVSVVALFAGMIVALQTGHELARFQLQGTIGNIVAASVCREMGPVFAAIIVAGRVGSAMAAELGTMKVSEEILALETSALNPIWFLVVPRVFATMVMIPALTAIANVIGILGGMFIGTTLLDMSPGFYWDRTIEALKQKDIFTGLLKSEAFAVVISVIACYQGLNVEGGAEGVGKATTSTVVSCIVSIIIVDCI